MLITREIIFKELEAYSWDTEADIVEHKNGDMEIVFRFERPQMDLIYDIASIVQDIIEDARLNNTYLDVPWIRPTSKNIRVIFKAKDFS